MKPLRIAVCALTLALLAGCTAGARGGGGPPTGHSSSRTARPDSGSTTGSGTGSTTGSGTGSPVHGGTKVLAWLPFGPANPSAPSPQMSMYGTLYSDCTADPTVSFSEPGEAAFWRSALYACRALRGSDRAAAWHTARQAWQQDGGSQFPVTGCRAAHVQAFLVRFFAIVRSGSDLERVALGGHSHGLACPPGDVSIDPVSGPARTLVTLHWTGSPDLYYSQFSDGPRIYVGGLPADGESDGSGESATVTMPEPGSGATSVPVVVRYDGYGDIPLGTFTYTDPASTG